MSKTVFARPVAALCLALALVAPPAYAHHDDAAEHAAGEAAPPGGPAEARLGDLTVADPWSRATPPMANVAAGYLTIRNAGRQAERLVRASSPAASRVEIHWMEMEDDVMTMREMEEGIEIPAGGAVELAPGGYHLMLVGLAAPLTQGEHVPLTLNFEGGSVDVVLDVQGMGARTGPSGHGGH